MPGPKSRAPEIPGDLVWLNVEEPVTLSSLGGSVVLLAMGSFSSSGFLQSLSALERIGHRFENDLVILCVHMPVFEAEQNTRHVLCAIGQHEVKFPVIHDPGHVLARLYEVRQRPACVLIDTDGSFIGSTRGAGGLDGIEKVIAHRLSLRGSRSLAGSRRPRVKHVNHPLTTLRFPGRLLVARDRIYMSDAGNHRILVTSRNGHILRQYGGEGEGFIDGLGVSAAFSHPQGMSISDEFLYVADTGNHALRRINLRTDEVDTLAGSGRPAAAGSVSFGVVPAKMSLHSPSDVVCHAGKLFVSMTGLHQIWSFSLTRNVLEPFSGSGQAGLLDGPPALARFDQPEGLTICGGRLYCVDAMASAIRCIDPASGIVTTLVGNDPYTSGDRDGRGREARLQFPTDIKCDEVQRMLWVADTYNNRIRRIGIKSGLVTGVAADRPLDEPAGLAFDNDTLYIANTNAHEVLRMNPDNGHTDTLDFIEEYSDIQS